MQNNDGMHYNNVLQCGIVTVLQEMRKEYSGIDSQSFFAADVLSAKDSLLAVGWFIRQTRT